MPYLRLLIYLLACTPLVLQAQQQYGYEILDRKPQSRDAWVQGLEIVDGQLYVSAGGRGSSRLLRWDFEDGSLDARRKLDPRLFAEGLTVFGERVYQLTWHARRVLVYNRDDLRRVDELRIRGQGWGLTHNDKELVYSDGSHQLHFVAPASFTILRSIDVTENGRRVNRLNELEWIDGRIWANVWMEDRIVIIDPDSGAVCGSVDLRGLLPATERQRGTGVLNGIARNPADGGIWVTGKNWPWLYRIRLLPKINADPLAQSAVKTR